MTIAAERLMRLEALAKDAVVAGEYDRSREYVRLARRIGEREREPLPPTFKRFTCKACDVYLRPGTNATVRLQHGHVTISCDCGSHRRFGYK